MEKLFSFATSRVHMYISKSRILLLTGNFYPELTGIGKYNGEMIEWLSKQGYDCTVLTTYPYYPCWAVQESYAKKRFLYGKERACFNNQHVIIYRCPHYIPKKPTGLKRVISDLSFFFSASLKLILLLISEKYDFVITVAPPFQLGLLGFACKKMSRAKFIYHVQDLQIDAAKKLEMISSEFLLKCMFSLEKYILKKADLISSVSEGMVNKLYDKSERPVTLFPNWVNPDLMFPIGDNQFIKEEFGFKKEDKIVLYSGAIGEKQGLENILKVASNLSKIKHLKFIICGSGPYKKILEVETEKLDLKNLYFLPLQPTDKLNRFLNMADMHLILQKGTTSDLVMPSKLASILSVGGVSIITAPANSSLHKIISSQEIGILVKPDDSDELTEAIAYCLSNDLQPIKHKARQYAQQYLSIESILRSFSLHLNN